MNLDLDDLDLETVAIIGAGVGSLDAGLSAATDITLLSDLLGGSLETGLIAVGAAGGVVIADKLGLVEVFES
ncbi:MULTISPECIES: hypothetical protein [Haloferax]|uniref:Uncharacterized protein n=3 Tax=Haloferax volcanii TaxID=2246 RepID=A0A384LDD5_HALVD|nr:MULTISPECIES: hypothetical protein [Haloferax]ADE02868.1 hypothetical protein HVO_0269 [Haloferax volcanii DS2]ELY23305.1 hypothetical protein C498_19609 [Haloferax volcanii DS2]MBS8121261.1 hypothetical protein [Haloferax volcanii]MBS8126269.1 hypothetical protein [Haloferax volcanii]MBS8130139.1 hypothetical protein [Haloferax volcanii]